MTSASLKKLLLTGLTIALVIAGATVAFAQLGDDSPSTTTSSTTSTAEDISGPCDEAEHANDPRCAGGAPDDDQGRGDDDNGRGRDHPEDDGIVDDDDDDAGEDISGPCDEAEHANDPECTGVPTPPGDDDDDRVDNSGPGSLNSGPGNAEDDDGEIEDHSGPGHGGCEDDSSGPGGGDDDSSGPGGGDDD